MTPEVKQRYHREWNEVETAWLVARACSVLADTAEDRVIAFVQCCDAHRARLAFMDRYDTVKPILETIG